MVLFIRGRPSQKRLIWRVHNGQRVNFWLGNWVPRMGTLLDYATRELFDQEVQDNFSAFVNSLEEWDWSRLSQYLPYEVCYHIARIFPPLINAGEDTVAWNYGHDGNFNLKIAYLVIAGSYNLVDDRLYKIIWRWNGLKKVKTCCWLMAKDGLINNLRRLITT